VKHHVVHIGKRDDLLAVVQLLAEQFGNARFDVGNDFLPTVRNGKTPADGFEIVLQLVVGLLVNLENLTAEVDG
jgi:hypothetical protein